MSGRQRTFKEEHPLGEFLMICFVVRACQSKQNWAGQTDINDELCTEKRLAEAQRIRDKYPDRIPVSAISV